VWREMGVLKQIVSGCINGTVAPRDVHQMLRKRHESKTYQKTILRYLEGAQKHALLVRFCKIILAKRGAPHFRNAMQDSLKALGRKA
jgi:hypothetical protein